MADTNETTIIGKSDKNNACYSKCKYNFKYNPIASCTALNQENMIQLTYPTNNNETITYNSSKYTPTQIFIYFPSYFSYYDESSNTEKKADAELSIYHTTTDTSNPLIVNIPIYADTTQTSSLITNIINEISKNAPNKNETTEIKFSDNFSLQSIIPKKPFYSFYDTFKQSNFIIFGKENSLSITSDIYNNKLTKILNSYELSAKGQLINYNKYGPNYNTDDEIYIKCNPTGSSEDTTPIIYDTPTDKTEKFLSNKKIGLILKNFFQSKYGFMSIMLIIVLIIIMFFLYLSTFLSIKKTE